MRSQALRDQAREVLTLVAEDPVPPVQRVAVGRIEVGLAASVEARRTDALVPISEPDILAELLLARHSGLLQKRDGLIFALMEAHVDIGDPTGALAVLERHDVRVGRWFESLGAVFKGDGNLAQAIYCYRTALSMAPSSTCARALLRLDPAAVAEILGRPIPESSNPGSVLVLGAPLRLLRVEALLALSRGSEALQVIEQVLADDPDNRRALRHLAQADPVAAEMRYRELVG